MGEKMTANEFRKLALSMPESVEGEHMSHPDFRVGGKIFATIMPSAECGMVKLTIEQQRVLVKAEPQVFSPVKVGWGARGATQITLKKAKKASVREALHLAWQGTAPKKLLDEYE